MKECKTCHQILDDDEFPYRSDSKTHRKSCRNCETQKRKSRSFAGTTTPEFKDRRRRRDRISSKRHRADPKNTASYIVKNSKRSDVVHNRENNLTKDFVEAAIANGCSYCGDKETKMTMDRIDNTKGHTTDNVVAACYRCNMIRRSMPYPAWIQIVPAIRKTFEDGLFDDWSTYQSHPR